MENTLVELADVERLALASSSESSIEEAQPQVIFYSSGEASVGVIYLRLAQTGELLWMIEWDLVGRFSLLRRGETSEP